MAVENLRGPQIKSMRRKQILTVALTLQGEGGLYEVHLRPALWVTKGWRGQLAPGVIIGRRLFGWQSRHGAEVKMWPTQLETTYLPTLWGPTTCSLKSAKQCGQLFRQL